MIRQGCRRRLRFRDGSVEHILCFYFHEHVYPNQVDAILTDFRRVLRLDGTLYVIVPAQALLSGVPVSVQVVVLRPREGASL